MTSLICVAAALLLCLGGQSVEFATCEPAGSAPPQPLNKIQLGPLSMEIYANVTRNQDKLRFSKGFYKLVIRNGRLPDLEPVSTHKISYVGEFVRCENLTTTLAQPEAVPLIECRPLGSYLSSGSAEGPLKASNRDVLYAHRYSLRSKIHHWFSQFFAADGEDSREVKRRTTVRAYALRPELVESKLKATLTRFKLLEPTVGQTTADFFGPNQQTAGLHLEASGVAEFSANLFVTVNASGLSASSATYPDGSLSSLYAASANGLIISLNEFSCKQSDSLMPLSLDQSFSLVFQYLGTVEQTRDPSGGYNTSIRMSAKSTLIEGLNFELEQTFVNEPDGRSGWEAMRLLHAQLGLATVDARWTGDSQAKRLRLFGAGTDVLSSDQLADDLAALVLALRDEPTKDPDHVSLTLKINRHLLAGFWAGIRQAPGGFTMDSSHDEL